jgi:predicted nucleic acid-binding protein
MEPVKAVVDSDILIDYLQGIPEARTELRQYREPCYSVISWMEVMAGAETPDEARAARNLLQAMRLVELDRAVAARAVELRREKRLKLPDAVILATADVENCLLVTRNAKDFDAKDPRIRIPYRLQER